MQANHILRDLEQKKYHPVYFLSGDEPYYIDKVSSYIEKNILSDADKEFNQTVMYGREVDAATVINVSKRYPMMTSHQVVIVKEAQDIKDFENLKYYFEKPQPSTILVICYKYKKIDKRKVYYQKLKDVGVIFESKKLYDNQIPDWISQNLRTKNIKISQKGALMLSDFLGNDLSKIVNELDKLRLVLPPDSNEITPQLIEKNIGISKDFNSFELQDALAAGNVLKANQIVDYFSKNQKTSPYLVVLIGLFSFFSNLIIYHYLPDKSNENVGRELRINPYFARQYGVAAARYNAWKTLNIISLIREYDARGKGFNNSGTSHGELLKELVFKILH